MYSVTTVMKEDNLFEAAAGDNPVLMDTDGQTRGQSPMELLLSAISGCASVDVVEIMKKKRRTVNGLTIETGADRRDEPWPRIFTAIRLHFILHSPDAKEKELEQAVTLSIDKYCSVAGMLRESADISYTWEIKPD
ncbi:MAG: OsmC family protein [Acidobacteriota bacterium]|nr:OsmC family protein [Acidobacteriota bacterium]